VGVRRRQWAKEAGYSMLSLPGFKVGLRGFYNHGGEYECIHGVAGAVRKGAGNAILSLLVDGVGCTSMDHKSQLIRLSSAIIEGSL
jgi:hypothetical protein